MPKVLNLSAPLHSLYGNEHSSPYVFSGAGSVPVQERFQRVWVNSTYAVSTSSYQTSQYMRRKTWSAYKSGHVAQRKSSSKQQNMSNTTQSNVSHASTSSNPLPGTTPVKGEKQLLKEAIEARWSGTTSDGIVNSWEYTSESVTIQQPKKQTGWVSKVALTLPSGQTVSRVGSWFSKKGDAEDNAAKALRAWVEGTEILQPSTST